MSRLASLCVASVLTLGGVALSGDSAPARAADEPKAAHGASQQKTCGQVLKEKAAFPAKLSELLATVADNLDAHAKWVQKSGKTKASAQEVAALQKVVKSHRNFSRMFDTLAKDMIKMENLAGAPHDDAKFDPAILKIWTKQAKLAREFAVMLQKDAAELDEMVKQRGQATASR